MKKWFLILLMVFISSNASAAAIRIEKVFDGTSVSGTGTTVASRVFPAGSIWKLGYWFKAAKAATPEGSAIRMTIEGSYADTPSTIFATMSTLMSDNTWTTNKTPEATCQTATQVPTAKYIRFVANGLTGNATGTTITAYMFAQELS